MAPYKPVLVVFFILRGNFLDRPVLASGPSSSPHSTKGAVNW